MASPRHVPVLLDRVVALLAPALEQPGSVMIACTLGLGGHSEAVLAACPNARVIGIESEREFGLSVLERLDGELASGKRSDKRELGVRAYAFSKKGSDLRNDRHRRE